MRATLRLVVDPTLERTTERYSDGRVERRGDVQAYDAGARKQLRALSERWVGLRAA